MALGYVPREDGDAMMIDLHTIEHLDFTAELPCEATRRECPEVAVYFVAHRCHVCGWEHPDAKRNSCATCWEGRSMDPARCQKCKSVYAHGLGWRIVQVLR